MTNTKTIKINKEYVIELMNYLSPIPFHNSLIIGAILEGIDGYENMNYNQRNNVKLLSDFINKRQLKRTRHSIRLNDDKIQMIFDFKNQFKISTFSKAVNLAISTEIYMLKNEINIMDLTKE